MGFTSYSSTDRYDRAIKKGFYTNTIEQNFKQREINHGMNPYGIQVRESCDSDAHPESLAIIVALDETGSMGSVPHYLVKDGITNLMEGIIQAGVPDPQVLFLGIGDHLIDNSPLQVGQFESGDEELDKWLTDIYLEGRGGRNEGESYLLAWYFAAYHTKIDCFEKRSQKGYLFTIGDEPTLKYLSEKHLSGLMGPGQYQDFTAEELYQKACEKYNVFHIHIKETPAGSRAETMQDWASMIGSGLIIAEKKEDVANIISQTVTNGRGDAIGMTKKDPTDEKTEEIL